MISITPDAIADFFNKQLEEWPLAAENYKCLNQVRRKSIPMAMRRFGALFNPARIVSTGAKIDTASLASRPCFLCDANRPAEQQALPLGDGLRLLVNPYPIFSPHFTIVGPSHAPQCIAGKAETMLELAREMEGFVIFYNGPRCGASAPDHFHFQAAPANCFPLISDIHGHEEEQITDGKATIWRDAYAPMCVFIIDGTDIPAIVRMFERLQLVLPWIPGEPEPMMNILCHAEADKLRLIVIPRRAHRPDFYGDGEGQMLISPASVDLAGWVVTPLEKDFRELDSSKMRELLRQTCLSQADAIAIGNRLREEPTIDVGILSREQIRTNFLGSFRFGISKTEGEQSFSVKDNKIEWNGMLYDELSFRPSSSECRFELADVVIGVDFHWERAETQRFEGELRLIVDDGNIVAINHIGIEGYLRSVVASEMSGTASEEFLKAHAIISRSWVMAQILRKVRPAFATEVVEDSGEHIRWYDRDDHRLFDVCADDHCQRYQGVNRQKSSKAAEAVDSTRGLLLWAPDGSLVDARFSKCCGGATEVFENCWEPVHHPCLEAVADTPGQQPLPDLSANAAAEDWIRSCPDAFCNTSDPDILKQVLNSYDQETPDFFRWRVAYSIDEISRIIAEKSGKDFGRIVDLKVVERGKSGRAVKLLIVGEKLSLVVGKELEIRRLLSPTHLYSSAIAISRQPDGFLIEGAGWGHGVGLCQIGAAVMGAKGYSHADILAHYFPGASIAPINPATPNGNRPILPPSSLGHPAYRKF